MTTDLLGHPLTEQERRILAALDELVALSGDPGLAPNARSAVLAAIAPLGVAATGLGLRFEHLIDHGV
ncbi:hypothetical protein [Microbacterium sp. ZXX196]|uniref:hypothetical protein n=1 Tax=Microbacterium sp. ZXX196 TaxID=2609291 RepID=UPI0012BA2B9E|nr:hypothetical protein [Microbacterium sp. ZXX196]MTE24224.1 hypothetical protein [Microbacterium sp. ZXX196]